MNKWKYIEWVKPTDRMPPNDYDYPCYIKFLDDGHESLSDGGTIHDTVKVFEILWKEKENHETH